MMIFFVLKFCNYYHENILKILLNFFYIFKSITMHNIDNESQNSRL